MVKEKKQENDNDSKNKMKIQDLEENREDLPPIK